MARVSGENRPLGCVGVHIDFSPSWDNETGKFSGGIPSIKMDNNHVVNLDDNKLMYAGTDNIRLQKQLDLGLITIEEFSATMAVFRKMWNNEVLDEMNLPEDGNI